MRFRREDRLSWNSPRRQGGWRPRDLASRITDAVHFLFSIRRARIECGRYVPQAGYLMCYGFIVGRHRAEKRKRTSPGVQLSRPRILRRSPQFRPTLKASRATPLLHVGGVSLWRPQQPNRRERLAEGCRGVAMNVPCSVARMRPKSGTDAYHTRRDARKSYIIPVTDSPRRSRGLGCGPRAARPALN